MKLAIVTTHPIQYNAPLFRILSEKMGIDLHVFYTWEQSINGAIYDPGFGKSVKWDIPLLEGYPYSFVRNTSMHAGSHHYRGIVNPELIPNIEAWGPEAILVYGWNFASHLKCLRYFHGKIPVLFRGDSTLLNEKPGLKRLARRWFLRWVYSFVDMALYVGQHNKEYYLMHGLNSRQLWPVPHAVDNGRFQDGNGNYEQKAKEWKKDIGISENEIVLLYAGKLEPRKNPEFLVRLSKEIQIENLKFLVVGNGPLENTVSDWAMEDKRVVRLDFQNQSLMPIVYRLGNIFILPSQSETWGLAINEAMACNRPVLISDKCGAAPDLVKEERNGFVFKAADAKDAAQKLNMMLRDPEELIRMGIESGKIILDFTLEKQAESLVNCLSELHN